jgi:predicted nuclease of predicted toxin-antitoxin system
MKFILDAQLPKSISEFFNGHDIIHTSSLEYGNKTKDSVINDLSIQEQRIVITKDSDFYYSFLSVNKPYKLILAKLGNMRLIELRNYFELNSSTIITLMRDNYFIILERNKIRILK